MNGRVSADIEGPFVVFIIGMRINQFWRVWKWLPVAMAMPRMLRVLFMNRDKGLLGLTSTLGWRTVNCVQYWRSFEHLEFFARNQDDPHLEPWRQFNKRLAASRAVGIYHETFLVSANQYEAVYVNMPPHGLAAASRQVPVAQRGETARRRLDGGNGPLVPT